MPGFCDLNLNVSNLPPKSIDQLVEYAIKCKLLLRGFSIDLIVSHLSKTLKVGYDNLGLAIDYEFPSEDSTNRFKNKADRSKITIPPPTNYTIPLSLATRLKNAGRNIKIFNRINIRIKPSDINTYLQHLVIRKYFKNKILVQTNIK